jgi:hypothetical protein
VGNCAQWTLGIRHCPVLNLSKLSCVSHGGFIEVYSHLGSITFTGSEFTAGQQIGVVGASGVSLGPHLLFGMLFDNHLSVDPKPFFALPLCGAAKPAVVAAHAPPHVSEIWTVGHNLASSKRYLECAPAGGQFEFVVLTPCVGLLENRSHGQTSFP